MFMGNIFMSVCSHGFLPASIIWCQNVKCLFVFVSPNLQNRYSNVAFSWMHPQGVNQVSGAFENLSARQKVHLSACGCLLVTRTARSLQSIAVFIYHWQAYVCTFMIHACISNEQNKKQAAFLRKIGANLSSKSAPAPAKKAAPAPAKKAAPAPTPAPAPVQMQDDPRKVLIEGLESNISELDLADVLGNVGKVRHCLEKRHLCCPCALMCSCSE